MGRQKKCLRKKSRAYAKIVYMYFIYVDDVLCSSNMLSSTQGKKQNNNVEKHKFQQKQTFEKRFIKKYWKGDDVCSQIVKYYFVLSIK